MTNKPMTILEQITLAASWGWSAVLKHGLNLIFIGISENRVLLLDKEDMTSWFERQPSQIEDYEITSFLYAGQLLGSEPIPEGTVFRNKEYGTRIAYVDEDSFGIVQLRDADDKRIFYRKDELEPYFN